MACFRLELLQGIGSLRHIYILPIILGLTFTKKDEGKMDGTAQKADEYSEIQTFAFLFFAFNLRFSTRFSRRCSATDLRMPWQNGGESKPAKSKSHNCCNQRFCHPCPSSSAPAVQDVAAGPSALAASLAKRQL